MFSFQKNKQIKKELNKITVDDFSKGGGWIDNVTFHCYLDLPEKLKKLLETEANVMECEYWKDENSFHYLAFEDMDCDSYKKINEKPFQILNNLLFTYSQI